MRRQTCSILAAALVFVVARTARAQEPTDITKLFQSAPSSKSLSNADIVAGLKEALEVGTTNTVDLTGHVDGYFGNAAIKILLPSQFQNVEQGLRVLGQGQKVDELVLAMNRAAEKAAPAAKDIFWSAIKGMSFDDARKILNGGDTAATDFFRSKTTPQLTSAFRPAVSKSMNDVGVTRQYKDLVARFDAIPFARSQTFDLDGYVVDKGLGGLFHVLGDQEKDIRTNPTARATDLLKEVFKR